jgi:hypothetical protein
MARVHDTLEARIPDLLTDSIWRMLSWFASEGQEALSASDERAAEQFLWALNDQGALLPKTSAHPATTVCRVVTSFKNFHHPVAWLNLAVALRVLSVTGDPRDPRGRDRLIACRECCDRSLSMIDGNTRVDRTWHSVAPARRERGRARVIRTRSQATP